jgi:hypothetical protein
MGVAAYNRGNAVIARQGCRDRGCRGCSACHTPAAPTPRPADWGGKAEARAVRFVEGARLVAERYGLPAPAAEVIEMMLVERGFGRALSKRVAGVWP